MHTFQLVGSERNSRTYLICRTESLQTETPAIQPATATRTQLLTAAEVLIRQRGYAGFSYADLADAVGLRKASIHHHFPSKTDLAVALLAAYDARYDEALAAIEQASTDGLVRLRAYADLYCLGIEKGLGCLCAAFAAELAVIPERLRTDLTRFFNKHIAWVERVLVQGQANGSVRNEVKARAFARLLIAALEGALMMERMLDGRDGFEDTLKTLEMALRPT